MEYAGLESIRRSYRDVLQEKGDYKGAAQLEISDIKTPIFSGYSFHGDTEISVTDFNQALQKIGIDLIALDYQFASAADIYENLMEDIVDELDSIDDTIKKERERIQDLNIILGNVSGFSSVKTFKVDDLIGDASGIDDYTFGAAVSSSNPVNIEISDVAGNGYEGNKYVYRGNSTFQEEYLDTSDRKKMTDNSNLTYYEYSRITAPTAPQYYPTDLNVDDIEAKCTLTITSPNVFNTIKIVSEFQDLSVIQISVSEDGVTFQDTLTNSISINDSDMKYKDSEYVYGSGILSFPSTNYLKLSLQSNATTNETIGFKRIILDDLYVDRNYTFPTIAFIEEYLAPLVAFGKEYVNSEGLMPYANDTTNGPDFKIGMILAVILAVTRGRPAIIGSYNFLQLPYDLNYTFSEGTIEMSDTILGDCTVTSTNTTVESDITITYTLSTLSEDNYCCAFNNRAEGIDAVFKYINSLLTFDSGTAKNALEISFIKNPSTIDRENGIRYLCKKLKGDSTTIDELALKYYYQYELYQYDNQIATAIPADISSKYEQYFKRYDKQESLGRTIDSNENIVILYSAHRHVIRINELTCFSSVYQTESSVETGEISVNPVDCVAIFANEYIPITFPAGVWIKYILTVNGEEYDIVPINSNKAGTKIIRFSGFSIQEDYTRHIPEAIKSVNLKIKIKVPNIKQSPFVSNVKICFGKPVVV